MTVTGQLKKALKSVCSEVARDKYEGKKDTYIVYNVATEQAGNYADNSPHSETVFLQIHLYMPSNVDYTALQGAVKKTVSDNGFSYPQTALNTVETATNIRHICLTTNKEKEI